MVAGDDADWPTTLRRARAWAVRSKWALLAGVLLLMFLPLRWVFPSWTLRQLALLDSLAVFPATAEQIVDVNFWGGQIVSLLVVTTTTWLLLNSQSIWEQGLLNSLFIATWQKVVFKHFLLGSLQDKVFTFFSRQLTMVSPRPPASCAPATCTRLSWRCSKLRALCRVVRRTLPRLWAGTLTRVPHRWQVFTGLFLPNYNSAPEDVSTGEWWRWFVDARMCTGWYILTAAVWYGYKVREQHRCTPRSGAWRPHSPACCARRLGCFACQFTSHTTWRRCPSCCTSLAWRRCASTRPSTVLASTCPPQSSCLCSGTVALSAHQHRTGVPQPVTDRPDTCGAQVPHCHDCARVSGGVATDGARRSDQGVWRPGGGGVAVSCDF